MAYFGSVLIRYIRSEIQSRFNAVPDRRQLLGCGCSSVVELAKVGGRGFESLRPLQSSHDLAVKALRARGTESRSV